jgi:hypothetical protein
MDFGQVSPNFTEFSRFFQKPAGSEGADFLVSAGFLNTAENSSTQQQTPINGSVKFLPSIFFLY